MTRLLALDFPVYVTTAIHPWFRWLWSAWDWLTGRRTRDLGWVLWLLCVLLDVAGRSGSSGVGGRVWAFGGYCYLAYCLWAPWPPLPRRPGWVLGPPEWVALQGGARAWGLSWAAGVLVFAVPLGPWLPFGSRTWGGYLSDLTFILVVHAALEDRPGSGSSVLSRLGERGFGWAQ